MSHILQSNFTKVDNEIIRNPDIPLKEKGLYTYLASYANNTTLETTVGINKMAAENGVTPSTIKRCLEKLVEMGVIKRVRRKKHESSITTLVKPFQEPVSNTPK